MELGHARTAMPAPPCPLHGQQMSGSITTYPVAPVMSGVWVVYYSDWSGAWVFDTEVAALRCAVEKSAQVKFAKFGEELR